MTTDVPERPVPRTALISRTADFWLLGGASIAVWCVMRILEPFQAPGSPAVLGAFVRTNFANLVGAAAVANLIVNYPHFMASYRIAYSPGRRYVREHWFSLIAVPASLAAAIAIGYFAWETRSPGALAPLASLFTATGLQPPFRPDLATGASVMSVLVHFLLLLTGWHYGKQVYGACLIYARYDGYSVDDLQRRLLRWSIHGIWISRWVQRLSPAESYEHMGVPFLGLALPALLFPATVLAAGVLVGLLAAFVVAKKRRTGRFPSPNAAVPFVAFLFWWYPPLESDAFTSLLVPLFHAIQYVPFVFRAESAGAAGRDEPSRHARFALIAFFLIVAGVLAFELVPRTLDHSAWTAVRSNAFFFMAAALLFLNLHHYCIDAAIWRMRDPRVRDVLL